MRVGNDPKDWGDLVFPKEDSNPVVDFLKTIGKIFSNSK